MIQRILSPHSNTAYADIESRYSQLVREFGNGGDSRAIFSSFAKWSEHLLNLTKHALYRSISCPGQTPIPSPGTRWQAYNDVIRENARRFGDRRPTGDAGQRTGRYLGDPILEVNAAVEQSLLTGSILLILVTELLNSALEAVVDRIGPQRHELAKRAKDMGSAAAFISMVTAALVWILIAYDRLWSGIDL